MTQYILRKKLDTTTFENYLKPAQETNQFSNGGHATQCIRNTCS